MSTSRGNEGLVPNARPLADAPSSDRADGSNQPAGSGLWRSRLLLGAVVMLAWYVFYFYWLSQGGRRLTGVGAALGGGLALAAAWTDRTRGPAKFLGVSFGFAIVLWTVGKGVAALAVGLGWD